MKKKSKRNVDRSTDRRAEEEFTATSACRLRDPTKGHEEY